MKKQVVVSAVVLCVGFLAVSDVGGQIITSVVRSGGQSGNRDPVGAYTGTTAPLATQAGGLMDGGNYVFSDRTYPWYNTPTDVFPGSDRSIVGSEYVRTFNSDKDSGITGVTYTVTTSATAIIWITCDDRIPAEWNDGGAVTSQQAAVDLATAAIAGPGTFVDTGLDLFIQENSTTNRQMSVYAAMLPAGVYVFGRQNSGRNFYTIGALPPDMSFNPPPLVDAKPDTLSVIRLGEAVQLGGTVTDEPPLEGDPGELSWYWYQGSGPGTATFSDALLLDPTVTFNAGGIYELVLQATDGEKDANDVVRVWVKDRADEVLLAYYPLDGDGQDASGGGRHLVARDDTTFAAGILNEAASFDGANDDMVQADPNLAVGDLLNGGSGISVSVWVKSNVYDTDKGFVIFQEPTGGDNMCIRYDEQGATGGGDALLKMGVATTAGVVQCETSNFSQTTDWQHVVMTWERGSRIRCYIDGIEEAYTAQSGPVDAALANFGSLILGRGGKDTDPNTGGWDGLIDEVRIYNYALALEDEPGYESVRTLTAIGPVVAHVNAGGDINVNWRPGAKSELNGEVLDYGRPAPMTIEWSTESGPGQAEFDDAMSAATMVSFPESGVYVLKLTVTDEGKTIEDTVTATVNAPTCADVIADGKVLMGDVSGPDGVPDCRVDLYDFARLALDWLRCNDPGEAECDYPF